MSKEKKNKKNNTKNKGGSPKRLIALLLVLLVVSAFYLYQTRNKENNLQQIISAIPFIANFNKTQGNEKKVEKTLAAKPVKKKEKITSKKIVEKTPIKKKKTTVKKYNYETDLIRTSNKYEFIREAACNIGKEDPFVDSIGKIQKLQVGGSTEGSLPMPPSLKMEPQEEVSLKGFIGDKVIVKVDGMSTTLIQGEEFRGVKALVIDTVNLRAKFKKGKKIITKNIKVPQNSDFQVIDKTNTNLPVSALNIQ